ncbi:MAG: lysine 2,3-aminomutase, partial [Janthinobacterium sp.]
TIHGEKLFALQFLQARNPDWVRRPFYAQFDAQATWMDDLKPAFGHEKFFFETDEPVPQVPHKIIRLAQAA